MSKYLPTILFAICIAIALILAWSLRPMWPAALAIALSGAALAMALRAQSGGGETAYLIDEITALQESDAELRAELANARSMIDELADVVEQIASVTADGGTGASREQLEAIRLEMAALDTKMAASSPDDAVLDRLSDVETRLGAIASQRQPETNARVDVAAAAAPNGEAGRLRSLIARANGQSEPPVASQPQEQVSPAATTSGKVSLTPVFEPTLGAPTAFVVSAADADTADTVDGLFRHAAQISRELEGAKKDVRLFVRLSPMTLAHMTVRRDIIAAIDAEPALQRRLTMLTPQEGFDETAQNTLVAIAERGCGFALDAVRDWSINLAALSRVGLRYIVVDGMAMARSAQEQGGDPRRLAQALEAHGIALIAGGVYVRDDIDTVRALEPVLVMGDGLGIPRYLDEPA